MDVGLFGKLPSHGDFLRRRVSDAFLDVWDAWLQACLAASRATLGDRWLDVYLTSPVWRFVCAPGTFGPTPVIGLLVPSVDRVGRYFPLTLVAELPDHVSPVAAATESGRFFERAERLVIDTLEAEEIDFEVFDERVIELGQELEPVSASRRVVVGAAAWEVLNGDATARCHMPLGSAAQLGPALGQLLSQQLSVLYHPLVLWWTEGSSMVEPSCLIARGLPEPDAFVALLDGSWSQHRWRSIPVEVGSAVVPVDACAAETVPYRFRSAAATEVGLVREINEDAFVERPEIGLWAVADGLGGHRDGEIASRMVCDALADFMPQSSLEDTVEAVRERLQAVNRHLFRSAMLPGSYSGSTVVVLLARGSRCAALWAGDSRLYRCRDGRLEQLSRDHSAVSSTSLGNPEERNVVTRAVGVASRLLLDAHRDEVRAGDRFLLCSDGLTRTVPDVLVQSWMEQDVEVAVRGLVESALNAGAPDNVTVLVAEACAEEA